MKVLILGANGMLGPYVVDALEADHTLRLTDVNDFEDSRHEYFKLDVSDLDGVVDAAEGMDAIVNLSVLRPHRQIAFDVNARGAYNAMEAAVRHNIPRVINTGPHFTIAGPTYEDLDYRIGPDAPSASGTYLYALTKSLGQEISSVFTENHDVHVLTLLFYNFRAPGDPPTDGQDVIPYAVSWEDAGRAFGLALTVGLDKLPSRCEVFYIFTDLPHEKFSNEKAKRVLGWQPQDRLEHLWRKSVQ